MVGFAIFMLIVLLVLFVFALCTVSSRADQESERMGEHFRDRKNRDAR